MIASLNDSHPLATAAAAAERAAGRSIGDGPAPRFVTAALNVSFLKPTPLGGELVLRARVVERSERKAVVEVELSAGESVTARGNVVAVPMPASMMSR
jgi:acyl-coenzyme A thioesterase PaaI-like protein